MKRLAAVFLLLAGSLFGADYPWMGKAPAEIAQASLQPDTVLDEIPCDWRPTLTPLISPLVQDCTTAREAVNGAQKRQHQRTGLARDGMVHGICGQATEAEIADCPRTMERPDEPGGRDPWWSAHHQGIQC